MKEPRSLTTSLSAAAIAIALLSSLVACGDDDFGYKPRGNPAYGSGATNSGASGDGSQPTPTNNTPPASTPPPDPSSSSPPDPTPSPSTTPSQTDAGTSTSTADASTSSGAGTCASPKCAAGNGFCGCKAKDGAGNLVLMGCQDGSCGCFDANGNDTNDFDAPCTDATTAATAFMKCTCN